MVVTIATIAGVTITLPGLLSGAWTTLKFAYDLYGQVDLRRTQLKLCLDRCSDLLLRVAQSLPASEVDVSARTRESIDYLQATCQSLQDVIDKLKKKGFLWCMVNQDKIDTQISDVQSRIADVFALFNFGAHIGIEEFQQRLLQARDQDQTQLITKLDSLSQNDQEILNALKYQDGAQKRVEELLVDVLRCVQNLGTEQSPQARFLRNASTVLQHASKGHIPDISADYVITSLEVDFQDTDSIGQGAFGRVFKGEWNGSRVAIKQMHIDNARTLLEDDRKSIYREVRLWTRLHHPNILNLYGACLEATSPFLVMQYCPFGNMCHYLAMEHPETNRVDISYDVVAGMTYLHNKGIVHADLKGANILIYKGIALVADFGLSAVIDGIQSRSAQSSIAASVRGTPQWMAPECHKGEPPRKASDIYGLGLTMWEAFSGTIPYQDVNRHGLAYVIAVENRRPERPTRLTEDAVWSIIQECWAPVAAWRPSIQQVQGKLSPYTTRLGSFVRTQSPALRPRSSTKRTGFEAFAPAPSPFALATAHARSLVRRSGSPGPGGGGRSNPFAVYATSRVQGLFGTSSAPAAKRARRESESIAPGEEGSLREGGAGTEKTLGKRLLCDEADGGLDVWGEQATGRKWTEQELLTGEEEDETIHSVRGKLFILSEQYQWKERGTGLLRLNRRTVDRGGARLLMRKDAVYAVLLNVTLSQGMSCAIAQDPRYLRLSVLTPSGTMHYNLRVGSAQAASDLLKAINDNIPYVENPAEHNVVERPERDEVMASEDFI